MRRLFHMPIAVLALGVLLCDVVLLSAASQSGMWIWQSLSSRTPSAAEIWLMPALLSLCLIGCGALSPHGLHAHGQMQVRVLAGLSLGAILLAIAHLILPSSTWPAGPQIFTLLIAFPLLCLSRAALCQLAAVPRFSRRCFVLGSPSGVQRVAQIIAGRPGLLLLGHADPAAPCAKAPALDAPDFADQILALGVTEIVLATECRQHWPVRALVRLRLAGIQVLDLPGFIERELGRVDVQRSAPVQLMALTGLGATHPGFALAKRSFDIAVACLLLIGFAPLLVLVMGAIRLESPGPALFWQKRVGQYGRPFWLVKLRSMVAEAEADGLARWAEEDDPRVTRIGRWLRQLHIDELPQLWNVLRGEMSFIGPRPERPEFVAQLDADLPYYSDRHHLRPGITGWAQINYPYAASLEDARAKLEYDLFYVKHAHVLLDAFILLQTARVLIWRSGAR